MREFYKQAYQSEAERIAAAMSQSNGATLQQLQQQQQQQQLQLQANHPALTSSDSLLSNAFDLIGGAQFLNHVELFQQQQQQQYKQQQQQHLHQQQQQQQLNYQQSITRSSSSTSSSPSTVQSSFNHIHPSLYHSLSQSQSQSHTPPMSSQHFIGNKHSISLTSSPIPSPPRTGTPAAATSLLNISNHQQFFNMHNHHHHQMDAQQQQHAAQTATTPTSPSLLAHNISNSNNTNNNNNNNNNNNPISSSTNNGCLVASATNTPSTTVAVPPTSTSMHQQQQHHQHQQHQHHQHGASNGSPYKSCWCFGDNTYHMKILVPAVASGAIIGKGGETIASLQKDSGARVKMSKSHDFYPGTTERVCLITGSVDGIMAVLDFVMDKIREKPDLSAKVIDAESKQSQERDKQVKILVPNTTAGMIIGKGGAFIKQIKEESGSYVQISQKPKDISLQERCITIIGDKENNKNACKMILSKIVEDPQSGTCLNVSYADVNGPVANFNPTGSPYATNQNAINTSTASLNSTLSTTIGGAATAAGLLVNGTGINLSLNLGSPNPAPNLAVATQLLEHIKVAMRGAGYSETATTEVCAALGVLAKYGVLAMGVGMPHSNGAPPTLGSYLGVSTLDQQAAAANAASAGNVFGAVGQVNLEQYTAAAAAAAAAAASRPTQQQLEAAAAHFDPFRHLGSSAGQATTPVSLNNNSFGLTAATGAAGAATAQALSAASLSGMSKSPTPGDLGAKDTKNVEIPEVIVGAILGLDFSMQQFNF